MGQISTKNDTEDEAGGVIVKVTFDKEIWAIINNSKELGKSNSGKVNHICVSWLSEHGILSGIIKKRMGLR